MKTKLFTAMLMLMMSMNLFANEHTHKHRNCSHHKMNDDSPSVTSADCDDYTMSSFANMNAVALYNYLLTVDDYECFETKIFDYISGDTELLFQENKVQHIASEAISLATNYDGTANGLYGIFQYLGVFTARYLENGISVSDEVWDDIQLLCNTAAAKPHILVPTTEDAYLVSGRLYKTCWANNIGSDYDILSLVNNHLLQLDGGDTWQSTTYNHAYYTSYYYLFDNFFRYAVGQDTINDPKFQDEPYYQNPIFYTQLNVYNNIITSLANIACDSGGLGNASDERFREFLTMASEHLNLIAKQTAKDDTEILYSNHLEDALLEVSDCADYLSGPWVYAVEGLLLNGADLGYDLEEIRNELDNTLFPDKQIFEDGNLLIHSNGISEADIVSLYEGIQQSKAQFFRLFELDENSPVDNDPNDKIQIRIYENQTAYITYNSFLYGAPSPGGGVYIEDATTLAEDRATLYTWNRNVPEDSDYSLEELVRHEYTHYLQGRFLVKGMWGTGNDFYNDKRLKWFEEGMAEFFAGSTDTDGVVDRNVVKTKLENAAFVTLANLVSEGTDVYNHGYMIWSYWYNNRRDIFKTLAQYTRQGNPGIAGFDSEISALVGSDEAGYSNYVDDLNAGLIPTWTPLTPNYSQTFSGSAETLKNDLEMRVSGLTGVNADIVYTFAPRRFHIHGEYSLPNGNTDEQDILNAYSRLDEILAEIQDESPYYNFQYATAYYSDIMKGNNPSATFHIVGPLAGGDICIDQDDDNICNDCDDTDPTLPAPFGTICDDGNPNTLSDVIQEDECTCAFGYCIPSINASTENFISNVVLNGQGNPSGNDNSYGDFTDLTAIDLTVADQYQLDLHKTALPGVQFYWSVWIDFNQNGIFEDDADELVASAIDHIDEVYSASFTVPQTALTGTTRMRVYLKEYVENSPTPCAIDDNSTREVEDYTINISPCPDGDGDGVCAVNDCDDTNNSIPVDPGLACNDNDPFTTNDIIQADGCTCAGTDLYCEPSGEHTQIYISNVSLEQINNTTNIDGYGDYTQLSAHLTQSQNYTLSLSEDTPWNYHWRAWIDYNHNGTFEGSEQILTKDDEATNTVSQSFTIPDDALNGITKMRVHLKLYDGTSTPPLPCDDISHGEVEDYTINISSTPTSSEYCEPTGQHQQIFISNVSLEQINNTTNIDGYGDYTQLSANLAQSQTYTLSLSEDTPWSYYWRAWIDYNQNGVFEGSEQVLYKDNETTNTVSQTFSVPTSALSGITRMRVYLKYYDNSSAPTPCENIGLGEVEDYTINIGSSNNEIGEVGNVTIRQYANQWTTVNLNNTYTDAVVVMGPISFAGGHQSTMNVRNVTSNSFEYQVDEWDYLDGGHATETIGYMVVEAGTHTLSNGAKLTASNFSLSNTAWQTLGYSAAGFTTPPIVMTQNCGSNGGHTSAVTMRIKNVTTSGFKVRLQEEENNDQVHSSGRVSYIAVEAGTSNGAEKFEVNKSADNVTHAWRTLNFSQSYANPVFLAKTQTTDGGDPIALRYRNLGSTSTQVKCEEEKSKNPEVAHTHEVVGWTVFDTPGNITATTNNNLIAGEETETPQEVAEESKVDQTDALSIRNYPNPFSGYTTIEYTLKADSDVTLTILDLNGRQIAVLVDGRQQTVGTHTATFDGSSYPAGMYYYTIRAGEYAGTQKMILAK